MKLLSVLLLFSILWSFADEPYQYLGMPPKSGRAKVGSLDRKHFLSVTNIQRTIVLPSMGWQVSGVGPGPLIASFKQAFESPAPIVTLSEELEALVGSEVMIGPRQVYYAPINEDGVPQLPRIRWPGIHFLTADGDFLTFGVVDEGFVFFTRDTLGLLLTKGANPAAPEPPPAAAVLESSETMNATAESEAPSDSGGR